MGKGKRRIGILRGREYGPFERDGMPSLGGEESARDEKSPRVSARGACKEESRHDALGLCGGHGVADEVRRVARGAMPVKRADRRCRRGRGGGVVSIARWDADTFLVADWGLSLPNTNRDAGGLMLHRPGGTREARWHFGRQLKPMGVGILRNMK